MTRKSRIVARFAAVSDALREHVHAGLRRLAGVPGFIGASYFDLDMKRLGEAHDWTLTPRRSEANFAYYARRALRNHPDTLTN